jgi:outer membrane protein OmpA-like peptidoglycan-associated protein
MKDAGFKGVLGPRDVGHLFESAGVELSSGIDESDARQIGRRLTADAVLYGHGSKFVMKSKSVATDNPEVLVGIDLYLLDVGSNSVNWVYSTRLYSTVKNYIVDLSKLSLDASRTLLASGSVIPVTSEAECWDKQKIALNLSGVKIAPKVAKKSAVASKVQPKAVSSLGNKKATTAPRLAKTKPIAKPAKKVAVKRLAPLKPTVLRKLFDGRSSRLAGSAVAAVVSLGKKLNSYPKTAKFVFEGHVDATANNSGDFWVSAQQAGKLRDEVVKRYPNLKGRIEIAAKGGKSPLVPNINKRSRQRNHRIEIRSAR